MGGIGSPEKEAKAGSGNPFKDVRFFVNPEYAASVEATAAKHPDEAAAIRKVATNPTGVWLSDIKAVENLKGWLDEAKKQQDASGVPTMTVIVVYNLPNRDCSAESSAGENSRSRRTAKTRYRTDYIDPITAQFKAHAESAYRRHPGTRFAWQHGHQHEPCPSVSSPGPSTRTASSTPSRASSCPT
jgi:cellulose 1,4-beta-cellobiosidase